MDTVLPLRSKLHKNLTVTLGGVFCPCSETGGPPYYRCFACRCGYTASGSSTRPSQRITRVMWFAKHHLDPRPQDSFETVAWPSQPSYYCSCVLPEEYHGPI